MNKLVFLLFLFFSWGAQTHNQSSSCTLNKIFGVWQYYKFIYEGKEHPPLHPDLQMIFEFNPNGTNRLYWTYKGQNLFCERKGQYIYKDCVLLDKITWVNPNNSPNCASDPDMRKGRITKTKLQIINGELYLWLSLAGKPFIYVWRKKTRPAPN
ncbi:MAG: hypothetical protein D6797_07995 [Bdellovibrio sp.]|nr:MAG: hypothetical protein D6797_07995 [Bdellovibrio sp.]